MNATWRPTYVLDVEELVDRAHRVALIAEALRTNPTWQRDGDTGRRRAARRLGFARWMAEVGEIGERLR